MTPTISSIYGGEYWISFYMKLIAVISYDNYFLVDEYSSTDQAVLISNVCLFTARLSLTFATTR
jgi:hypothetical protein